MRAAPWRQSLPEGVDEPDEALPGIGPATAAGITAFSRDVPCLYLETNVRAVFIHRFFAKADAVTDRELRPLVQAACPSRDVRGWYYALLDVGAHLKKTVANPTRKATAYTRQSAFEGSRRQKRAWLVREVLACPGLGSAELHARLDREEPGGRAPSGCSGGIRFHHGRFALGRVLRVRQRSVGFCLTEKTRYGKVNTVKNGATRMSR